MKHKINFTIVNTIVKNREKQIDFGQSICNIVHILKILNPMCTIKESYVVRNSQILSLNLNL